VVVAEVVVFVVSGLKRHASLDIASGVSRGSILVSALDTAFSFFSEIARRMVVMVVVVVHFVNSSLVRWFLFVRDHGMVDDDEREGLQCGVVTETTDSVFQTN
jgi:hypothetical protein